MLKYALLTLYMLAIFAFTIFMISSCATIKKDQAQIEAVVHDVTDELIEDIIEDETPIILTEPPIVESEFKIIDVPVSIPMEIGVPELSTLT